MNEKPKARVLVAEDNKATAHFIRFTLERAGFFVTAAGNGMEALVAAQQHQFDLVVTDDRMPRMNGYELCLRLKDDPRYSKTPLIFVTAKRFEIESEIINSFGHDTPIINKPFSIKALLKIVGTTLGLLTVA